VNVERLKAATLRQKKQIRYGKLDSLDQIEEDLDDEDGKRLADQHYKNIIKVIPILNSL